MRLFDRSRVVTDWECPRKRYLGYEYGGKGLATNVMALPLREGAIVHDVIQELSEDGDFDGKLHHELDSFTYELREANVDEYFVLEQAAMLEGALTRVCAPTLAPGCLRSTGSFMPSNWKL